MSMRIKPGYVNPLSMMGQKKTALAGASPLTKQKSDKKDDVRDLQNRQQALQNSVLLLKSTTDGAAGASETQDILQEKLEEIAAELKTAKAQEAQAPATRSDKENFDRYEKGSDQTDLPGLYEVQKGEEMEYNIVFRPYEEEQ